MAPNNCCRVTYSWVPAAINTVAAGINDFWSAIPLEGMTLDRFYDRLSCLQKRATRRWVDFNEQN